MSVAAPKADAPAYILPGVNLFASGVYRGTRWTPEDIRQIAANARSLGPRGQRLLTPPAAPGHEDDDGWQHHVRTDEPAAGWVDPETVAAVPDPQHPGEMILKGDVVNVPPEMAEAIRRGEYKYGSAEIYSSFVNDFGVDYGKALRKFSYLGSMVPQCKRLGPLPQPRPMAAVKKFAERAVRLRIVRQNGQTLCFAERSTMTRDEAIAAIKAAMPTVTDAWFDGIPDEKLVEMVAALPQPATTPTAPAEMMDDGTQPGMPAADPMAMTRDDLIAALVGMGQDAALLQGMDDQALRELAKTLMSSPMGEGRKDKDKPTPMSERPKPGVPKTPADKAAAETLTRFAEINRRLDAEAKALANRKAAFKREKAEAFCEGLVAKGILRPFEKADYVETLARLDDSAPVHKFTENGRTETLSAYALKCRQLAARPPVVRFGEKLPGGDGGAAGKPDKAAAVRKATAFAEANERPLKAAGYTPQKFVSKFSEMFDKDPGEALKALPAEYRA